MHSLSTHFLGILIQLLNPYLNVYDIHGYQKVIVTLVSFQNRTNFNDTYFGRLNLSSVKSNDVGHLYAPFAYDAVWAIALALNATIANGTAVENFTYDNSDMADQLTTAMENVKFTGISVRGYVPVCVSYNIVARVMLALTMMGKELDILRYINTEVRSLLQSALLIVSSSECDCQEERCVTSSKCDCEGDKCDIKDLLYEMIALNDQSDKQLNINLKNNYTEDCIWWNRDGMIDYVMPCVTSPDLVGRTAPKDRRTPSYVHLDHGVIYTCFLIVPIAVLFLAFLLCFNTFTIKKPSVSDLCDK